MKKILLKVSIEHYAEFRKRAMSRCSWTAEQFKNRKIGRTELTNLEYNVLEEIASELQAAI